MRCCAVPARRVSGVSANDISPPLPPPAALPFLGNRARQRLAARPAAQRRPAGALACHPAGWRSRHRRVRSPRFPRSASHPPSQRNNCFSMPPHIRRLLRLLLRRGLRSRGGCAAGAPTGAASAAPHRPSRRRQRPDAQRAGDHAQRRRGAQHAPATVPAFWVTAAVGSGAVDGDRNGPLIRNGTTRPVPATLACGRTRRSSVSAPRFRLPPPSMVSSDEANTSERTVAIPWLRRDGRRSIAPGWCRRDRPDPAD